MSAWEKIAGDLKREREAERCLCFPERFREYLRTAGLPFGLDGYPGPGGEGGKADLFIGWRVLEEERELLSPGEICSALRPGGEARIFGLYRRPGRESPGTAAVSLGTVAGWLKTGPFNRYTLRKRGIYYDCRLQKDA